MKTILDILNDHSFFQDLSQEHLAFIAGCGKNVVFKENQVIAKPGDPADEFYLIRDGQASLILDIPPYKPFIYQTLGENEILGLAWMIPPYRWTVTARALHTVNAISIDAACLRKKCENDPALGYNLMKHLVRVLVAREEAALLHLIDIYGSKITC